MMGTLLLIGVGFGNVLAKDATGHAHVFNIPAKRVFCQNVLHGEVYSRTELFFGLSRDQGPDITEQEFQDFIDTDVTPLFPDGLTLLTGRGQWANAYGSITQEETKLLILFYRFSEAGNQAVEEIRQSYVDLFQQESVLRVDEQACVSF